MNADVLTTRVADGIAVVTLGIAKQICFDEEMGDALTEALDDPDARVGVVTDGAPGYFIRHFSITSLLAPREVPARFRPRVAENASYNGGFFDKTMALCEGMSKPVIAAISGTCLAGGFEFAISCDLCIAEDGDYLIGLPEANLGLLPGTERLPRTIGTPAALMHILMGDPINPQEAVRPGPSARDRPRQGSRSRDLDRASPVIPPTGISCLHQASRAQRDRDAAGTGTGARTKSVLEIVRQRTSACWDAVL